jgi:hypothetical protein
MELEFSRLIFVTHPNIKFHENPFSGSRVVPCGQTDMTKLTVAFCNFANAPETNGDFKHCQNISADFGGQGEGKCRF